MFILPQGNGSTKVESRSRQAEESEAIHRRKAAGDTNIFAKRLRPFSST